MEESMLRGWSSVSECHSWGGVRGCSRRADGGVGGGREGGGYQFRVPVRLDLVGVQLGEGGGRAGDGRDGGVVVVEIARGPRAARGGVVVALVSVNCGHGLVSWD
jgi:hypothetical protein